MDKQIVRWGILGTGIVARSFAEDLRLLSDARIVSVASRRIDRARTFASEFGAAGAYEGVTGLLDGPEVDVIYIATPHVRHREDCLACLNAGRAVLVEKPFTVNAAEAREVVELARRSDVFCMEAMWMRFHPLIRQVRSIIQSGALGSIRLLTVDFGYPTSFDPENRFYNHAMAGGALLDRGVYLLSLASFLLGKHSEFTGSSTIGPTGVDEQDAMILNYHEGSLAVLTTSLRSRLRNEALIVGTQGQIVIHDPFYAPRRVSHRSFVEPTGPIPSSPASSKGWKQRLKRHPLVRGVFESVGRPLLNALRSGDRTMVHHDRGHGYHWEASEVMRCLREGLTESPLMTLDDTLAVLEATDRLRSSSIAVRPR